MDTLDRRDVLWISRRLPGAVLDALKAHGSQLFLAGGFIRACVANEPVNDVDLFTSDAEFAARVASDLCNSGGRRERCKVHKTDNAYTVIGLGLPVQVIHRWTFASPQECVASFDFTIARAALWVESGHTPDSVCDPRFYADLAAKRLVYCSPKRVEEVGGSMLRVLKFYQRGYRIPLDSLGAVMARMVNDLDWESIEKSAYTQGISNEQQIAKVLTGLLQEVDPNIDPFHQSHLPADA